MRGWGMWAVAGAVIAQTACGAHGGHLAAPAAVRVASVTWRYEVVADARTRALRVEGWLARGSLADLTVRRGAERFVRDVYVQGGGGWREVHRLGLAFHAPECAAGCHVRYSFELREAADALHDTDLAIAWGDVIEASPSMWLLHPALSPPGARYRFHVQPSGADGFVTGTFPAEDGEPNAYEADASNIGVAPYAAFGPMRVRRVEAVAGVTLELAIAPAAYQASDDDLASWVTGSARTMARYFGCFPVDRAMILVAPARGDRVAHGETMGDGGASIVVEVGDRATGGALESDWVLSHEMAHLAVPSVSRRHHWMEEGVAVYVQPIARARAGEIRPEQVWGEFAGGMPKGFALHGTGGLDDTSDWATTYWGGATFCLLADLEIRKRTQNRFGFEDALRGILASGGSVASIWSFQRVLDAADFWVGTPVLGPMHDRLARGPWIVDLPRVFRDLGVIVHGSEVTLVDDAPLSELRRAITEPPAPGAPPPAACRGGPAVVAAR